MADDEFMLPECFNHHIEMDDGSHVDAVMPDEARDTSDRLRSAGNKSLLRTGWQFKSEGGPCEQGETAAETGCTPASGEGSKKPTQESSEPDPDIFDLKADPIKTGYRVDKVHPELKYAGKAVWGQGLYMAATLEEAEFIAAPGAKITPHDLGGLKILSTHDLDDIAPGIFNTKLPKGAAMKRAVLDAGYDGVRIVANSNLGGDQVVLFRGDGVRDGTADKLKQVSAKSLPPAERFQLDGLVREFRAMMERFRHFGIQVPTLSDRQIAESIRAALGFVQQTGDNRAKVLPVWENKSEGGPCEQGETAAQSGCVPASGQGSKEPERRDEEKPATAITPVETAKERISKESERLCPDKDQKFPPHEVEIFASGGRKKTVDSYPADWGTRPGEYTVYRAGSLNTQRVAVFLSPNFAGAEPYSRNDAGPVRQYKIQVKNPKVSDNLYTLLAELTGKTIDEVYAARDRAKDVGKWWQATDKKLVSLLKKQGHDAVVYVKPAPPATREMAVWDVSKFVPAVQETTADKLRNTGKSLHYRGKSLPNVYDKSALDAAARFLADKWNGLVSRYGRTGAAAMLATMLATFPIPGNIAAVIAAAEAARYFTQSPPIATELGKAMSALNETTGGALVKPPKFMGRVKLKRTDWKAVVLGKGLEYQGKGNCEPGETAAQTGCTPASGEGGQKPVAAEQPTARIIPPKEQKAWGKQHYEAWGKGLTPAEKQATQTYESKEYKKINGALRGSQGADAGEYKQLVTDLDAALAKAKLPEAVTVFRGIGRDLYKQLLAKVGSEFTDDGYGSTSLYVENAMGYGNELVEITLPQGSNAAYMDAAFYGDSSDTGFRGAQQEMTLPRGSRFKVIGTKDTENGKVIVAELVPAGRKSLLVWKGKSLETDEGDGRFLWQVNDVRFSEESAADKLRKAGKALRR